MEIEQITKLYKENERLVYSQLRDLHIHTDNPIYQDCEASGKAALVKCINEWDPKRSKLSTYSWAYIRKAIMEQIRHQSPISFGSTQTFQRHREKHEVISFDYESGDPQRDISRLFEFEITQRLSSLERANDYKEELLEFLNDCFDENERELIKLVFIKRRRKEYSLEEIREMTNHIKQYYNIEPTDDPIVFRKKVSNIRYQLRKKARKCLRNTKTI